LVYGLSRRNLKRRRDFIVVRTRKTANKFKDALAVFHHSMSSAIFAGKVMVRRSISGIGGLLVGILFHSYDASQGRCVAFGH